MKKSINFKDIDNAKLFIENSKLNCTNIEIEIEYELDVIKELEIIKSNIEDALVKAKEHKPISMLKSLKVVRKRINFILDDE